MSLISLNSRDENPADFTNELKSNLKLAPGTTVAVRAYGIRLEESQPKNELLVTSANNKFVVQFGNGEEQMVLNGVCVETPVGSYPTTGGELLQAMNESANTQLRDGACPGMTYGIDANIGNGINFNLAAGKVNLQLSPQAQPDPDGGNWYKYTSGANYSNEGKVSITTGGAVSTLEFDVEEENYSACADNEFFFFPHVPRQTAGVPDRTVPFAPAPNPQDGGVFYNLGGGGAATDTADLFLCGGGLVTQGAMMQDNMTMGNNYGNANLPGDWAARKDCWVNHGFTVVRGETDDTISLKILHGTPGREGEGGEIKEIEVGGFQNVDVTAVWDMIVMLRIVASNTAPTVAATGTGFISQLWVESTSLGVPPTLADERPLTSNYGFKEDLNPMGLSERLNMVYKCLSPGTGVVGNVQGVKIVSNNGNGQGDVVPAVPATWDGSIQVDAWAFADRQSQLDHNSLLPIQGSSLGDYSHLTLLNMSKRAQGAGLLGFQVATFQQIQIGLVGGSKTGFTASSSLGQNEEDMQDEGQMALIQIPNLPLGGRLGATSTTAPIAGYLRLKSVYNGDSEGGAFWYEFNNPARIALNNLEELIMNQINIRITDEWGKTIQGLDKHTSIILEFSPNSHGGTVGY